MFYSLHKTIFVNHSQEMVQGIITTEIHQTYDKKKDGATMEKKGKNFINMRECFRAKWKLFVSGGIVLTSMFIFSGIILYLNLGLANNCRKEFLNVHIIPYMYSNMDVCVSPIDERIENDLHKSLEFLINALESDEQRRFILPDIYPLWQWWKNQTNCVKRSVQRLIQEGRLDIAGGGWFIPDEASVHYLSFIDQFTWGLRHLQEIVGRQVAPDVSFLMDNYGHSREIAHILNQMDFRAVMLGGVSQREQCYRRAHQKLEFLWSDGEIFGTKGEKPNLFTSILDDRALEINNLFESENITVNIDEFHKNVVCQARGYSTNNVFIPVGSHFRFKNMKNIFHVIDSVMNLTRINPKYKLNVVYSTPSNYINSVINNNDRWWRSTGEFLPYSENELKFWTGYYSSRPSLKFLERLTNGFLQALKQMLSNSNLGETYSVQLMNLRQAVGLSQHHRSVMGIANQNTADYMRQLLSSSFLNAEEVASQALNKLAAKNVHSPGLRHETCLRLNISECEVSEESESFTLTIYNPSSRYLNKYVRIPVIRDAYLVRAGDGSLLRSQIVRVPKNILTIPGRKSGGNKELIFHAKRIPALGYKTYFITATSKVNTTEFYSKKDINLIIDKSTGKIAGVQRNNETYPMSQELLYYTSWLSDNSVFRPDSSPNIITPYVHTELINDGELVTEYKQDFASWASQIVRVYKDEDFIELKWIVGPIPYNFAEGKEVITSFTTNIKNEDSFYTDINGRGFERKRKESKLENQSIGEYIAQNYRPINTQIAINDSDYLLHIFNDRIQGGTSSCEGELQLMLHRRLPGLHSLGSLDERAYYTGIVATGEHWIFIGPKSDINLKKSIEIFAAKTHSEPWYFFANASHISYESWIDNYATEYSGIKYQLPKNLRVLTLEPWSEGKILLRLENTGDDCCSRININLQKMFSGFAINKATEVTLAGNFFKSPFTFETKLESNPHVSQDIVKKPVNFEVFISQSEIKTYILDVKPLFTAREF